MYRSDLLDAVKLLETITHEAGGLVGFGVLTDEEREAIDRAQDTVKAAGQIADLWNVPEKYIFIADVLGHLPLETFARFLTRWRRIDAKIRNGEIVVGEGVPVEVVRD